MVFYKYLLIIILIIFLLFLISNPRIELFTNKNKELKFIHITKTGGTSIEDNGLKHGIKWGRFDSQTNNNYDNSKKFLGSIWHYPFTLLDKKYKQKYDWFVVVRNPYDRVLSEFYCPWNRKSSYIKNTTNKKEFNDIIYSKIKEKENGFNTVSFEPQFKYVDNSVKVNILKLENLKHDFDLLMKNYNMNVKLDLHTNKGNKKYFNVNDFSPDVINLINKFYDKDFKLFGYKKKTIIENFENKNNIENNITICIKTFHRYKLLDQHIKDIRRLLPNIKIIVGDDSEDDYKKKNKKIIDNYDNILYLPFEYDIGLSKGRNEIVKHVKTKYVLLEDDSRVVDSLIGLKKALNFLENNNNYDIITGHCPQRSNSYTIKFKKILINNNLVENKNKIKKSIINKKHITVLYDNIKLDKLKIKKINNIDISDTHGGLNIFLARTDILKKYKWNNNLKLGEHKDFFFKLYLNNIKIAYYNKFIFKQYNSSLRSYDNNKFKMRKRAENILKNHNIQFIKI